MIWSSGTTLRLSIHNWTNKLSSPYIEEMSSTKRFFFHYWVVRALYQADLNYGNTPELTLSSSWTIIAMFSCNHIPEWWCCYRNELFRTNAELLILIRRNSTNPCNEIKKSNQTYLQKTTYRTWKGRTTFSVDRCRWCNLIFLAVCFQDLSTGTF